MPLQVRGLMSPSFSCRPAPVSFHVFKQRQQKSLQAGNYRRQLFGRRGHPLAGQECPPLAAPGFSIGFTEPGWLLLRKRRLAPREGLADGHGKRRPFPQFKRLGDQPQDVVILQPAVGDAAGRKSMELLGDYRRSRISPQVRSRRIEQRGIVDLDGTGSDCIAKAHIDLDRDASDSGLGAYQYATVLDILADRLGFEPIDIEDHAVIVARLSADLTKGIVDRFRTALSVAEQVQIARRPKWRLHPGHEQHRSLEDESVAML